ncbi:MAG: LysR family transcriptional regulator [Rhizobiales bacterium 62-17]|nr:LysR family transcriptional regulator [Hyphomicrobiales bacterium]OJY04328.1 MAG: LysR family transcriptional regulator [Rhizobiales bacterium 62-17]
MAVDLKSLRLFVAVADLGSISEGAKRCHLALAAASKRITDLEERTRLPLFVRHARGVVLTPAGHSLLAHARTVLSAMDKLGAELDDFQRGVAGVVRVSANASSIAQFLPVPIGSFLRTHPMLRVDLQERSSAEVVKAVQGGLADIGVFEAGTPAPDLDCLPFARDELAVVVAASHPLARRRRVGLEEVLNCEHVIVREGTAVHRALQAAAQEAQRPLQVRMQVGSFEMVCRMVEQGVGIGVVPRAVVQQEPASAKLRCLALDAPWASRQHVLGVRWLNGLSVAASALLQHLRAAMA